MKVALITGGSRGIGAVTAIKLAEAGYSLCINYRNDGAAAMDVVGKIQGSKTDYKEKLQALDIKVETKILETTTHLILGEKPAKKTEQKEKLIEPISSKAVTAVAIDC